MDPISIVGLLASIIQIADALTHLSSQFRRCIHTVRYAPKEVRSFHRDLSTFSASLRWFCEISSSCLKELETSPRKRERKKHIAGVIKECKVVEKGFKTLLSKFVGKSSRLPTVSSPVDRIRWYFRKPSVVGLRLSLESAKSTVELFMTLYICESLQRQIRELQEASKEIPEDLKHRLRCFEQQLKQQAQSAEENHERLMEHLEKIPYSAPMLIPGMLSILNETRNLEQNATRSLRKENRKIWQDVSSARESQDFHDRDPSPELTSVSREPQTPGPSPRSLNVVRVAYTGASNPTPEDSLELLPYFQPASPRTSTPPSNMETHEDPPNVHIEPLQPESSVTSRRRTASIRSSKSPEPRSHRSITCDNNNQTRGKPHERRVDTSETLSKSTNPLHSTADVLPSASSSSKRKEEKIHPESPSSNKSSEAERGDIVRAEVEPAEGGQRSSNVGSSPYKAMPPFLDEDWKGIRRRPSQ